jgi:hypothetical protein
MNVFRHRWIRYLIISIPIVAILTLVFFYLEIRRIQDNWRNSIACTPPQYQFIVVSGKLIREDNHKPIPNASILIHESNIVSDGCTIFDHETRLVSDEMGYFTTHPDTIASTGFNVHITIDASGCEFHSDNLSWKLVSEDTPEIPAFLDTYELHCGT